MCDMCRIDNHFLEAEKKLFDKRDIVVLKILQANIYEEMGWFEEAKENISIAEDTLNKLKKT